MSYLQSDQTQAQLWQFEQYYQHQPRYENGCTLSTMPDTSYSAHSPITASYQPGSVPRDYSYTIPRYIAPSQNYMQHQHPHVDDYHCTGAYTTYSDSMNTRGRSFSGGSAAFAEYNAATTSTTSPVSSYYSSGLGSQYSAVVDSSPSTGMDSEPLGGPEQNLLSYDNENDFYGYPTQMRTLAQGGGAVASADRYEVF